VEEIFAYGQLGEDDIVLRNVADNFLETTTVFVSVWT
jgi:hypothetical protein